MTARPVCSIVVAVFDNAATIRQTVASLDSLGAALPAYDLELVFVDDGSSDASLAVLREIASGQPEIRIVKLTRHFGHTAAMQAGLSVATGRVVGVMPARFDVPPAAFVEMIRQWEGGAKFIAGTPRTTSASSRLYWRLIRRFLFRDYPKAGYDCFLLDRQVVDDLKGINEKHSSIFALAYWLGYRPAFVTADTRRLTPAAPLVTRLERTLDSLIGFTYLPARVITVLGFATAALCLAVLARILIYFFLYRLTPPGWITVVGLVSLLGAMGLFAMGIVSEYLLRIFDETRKRPPFVVDQVVRHGSARTSG